MNEVSTRAVAIMLRQDKDGAQALAVELEDARDSLLAEGDVQAARFISVLQGLLDHTVLKEAARLDAYYAKALDRLLNTVQSCGWRLTEEGKREAMPGDEDKFSTWEEAAGKAPKGGGAASAQGAASSSGTDAPAGRAALGAPGSPLETAYYEALGVPPDAPSSAMRPAYRSAALRVHPDVSDAPDAEARFIELSRAYDVLSDEASRRLYDVYGAVGMAARAGAGAGLGNSRAAWDEFKPFKRENKRTKARDASRANSATSSADGATSSGSPASPSGSDAEEPVAGDVVEFPLSERVMSDLQDGRTLGLGLLVGRNKDRGDRKKLPADALDLCEVEPMRQEETASQRWIPDELSASAFVRLGDLKRVPVDEYDGRFDIWVISAPLSPGCGGPELPEEIML